MICPVKICKQEIPDDSIFCDQCGVHLGKCEKCGNIAVTNRCGKCGGLVVLIASPQNSTSVQNETGGGATVILPSQFSSPKLLLIHADGWQLEVKDGDILGRTTGQHASRLGQFHVISSRHAQVDFIDGKYFFTDLGSTNKSYLNRQVLQANSKTELNDGDEVMLANVSFVVKIM